MKNLKERNRVHTLDLQLEDVRDDERNQQLGFVSGSCDGEQWLGVGAGSVCV